MAGIASTELVKERSRGKRAPRNDRFMDNARDASELMKVLSHENRLRLLYLLVDGERSVTELEKILGLPQPTVSQQLARLRLDDLVETRREGKTIYYRLANDDVRRVMALMNDIFGRIDERESKSRRSAR